ncbi:MAG: stage 0 sporulation family protein [Clostridia bacterium]|nr:stage 0 sporulation family protein [Clostridia bacterium]
MDNNIIEENIKTEYEVVGVRFKDMGKVYYFDPCGISASVGDDLIVDTARGLEFGNVAVANKIVEAKEVVLPLRAVIRFATDEDKNKNAENKKKEKEAFDICLERIAFFGLEMKLVECEYTFDNSKLLFYFTSDGRVDFRELVKDLAATFRTRIELRQIGIRDETKMIGGLGVCGMPFCCKRFLDDFGQVTIKMAKEQNLSLNSQKISGACGRLMCCLRYEHNVYEEEIRKTPKVDSIVDTPDGRGVVCETVPLAGIVKVKFSDGEQQYIRQYHRDNISVVTTPKQNNSASDETAE